MLFFLVFSLLPLACYSPVRLNPKIACIFSRLFINSLQSIISIPSHFFIYSYFLWHIVSYHFISPVPLKPQITCMFSCLFHNGLHLIKSLRPISSPSFLYLFIFSCAPFYMQINLYIQLSSRQQSLFHSKFEINRFSFFPILIHFFFRTVQVAI